MKGKEPPGIRFEKMVHELQARLDPQAKVAHNEIITDRLGHARQFDVVIRGKSGGHPILGVIECKDLERRVGTPQIDAFVTKTRDVNANLAIMASRRGFSKPALEKARDYGIGTISLLRNDKNNDGPTIGVRWYAEIWSWAKVKLTVHFVAKNLPIRFASPTEILCRGRPVLEWWQKTLATEHANERNLGWMNCTVQFDRPRRLTKGRKTFLTRGLTFHALRERQKRTRMVQLSGDGSFRWDTSQITIPPKGWVCTDGFRTDFSDWDTFEGEIPPSTGFLDWRLTIDKIHFDVSQDVVDLMVL